jgi:hypothetical protein
VRDISRIAAAEVAGLRRAIKDLCRLRAYGYPKAVEPMTGIEPAYSAWEAISTPERAFRRGGVTRRARRGTRLGSHPAYDHDD